MKRAEALRIKMLGEFSLEYGEHKLSDENGRTRQVWTLLAYLLSNRGTELSVDRLVDVLWREDEIENPSGALKNLVYRARVMLNQVGRGEGREYINFRQGSYSWNMDIPCQVDAERMVKLYESALRPGVTREEQVASFMEIIELYRGDFLEGMSYCDWVVPRSTYYRGVFFDCVSRACAYLMETQRFAEADLACTKAMSIDPYEESVHVIKMRALIAMGRYQKALEHYDYVTKLFYRELGVSPSKDIVDVYHEAIQYVNGIEEDLMAIKNDLRETIVGNHAYYCEYEIFKNMYRVEARTVERSGQSVYVGLLTLVRVDGGELDSHVREDIMDLLKDVTLRCLRRGDVVSRFSKTQYVLMLPTLTFENSQLVMNRISRMFQKNNRNRSVALRTNFLPIDPSV